MRDCLASLIRETGELAEAAINNVKSLVQDLIDEKITPEEFLTKLHHELKGKSSSSHRLVNCIKVRNVLH